VSIGFGQNTPFRTQKGMVVSDCKIASEVGASILRKGGTAVDAAIATAFALAVTYPAAGNLGGGGFMVVRQADGKAIAIDYRERAPRRATRNMYLDASGDVRPESSTVGYLAAGVPGTVSGMAEAHRRYGKLPWRDLVDPAVRLARDGFAVSHDLSEELQRMSRLFSRFPESSRIFNRNGKFYGWGEKLVQSDLARTLARIRDQGERGFYEGETARLLAADMKANGGLIDEEDMRTYRCTIRNVLKGSYRGYDVLTMPPPSSGGIALLQMLGIVESFDLRGQGFGSAGTYHLMVESMKRAFADRAAHLGDPDFAKVPVTSLLNLTYLAELRRSIDPAKATPASAIKAGDFSVRESEHTTHFSVVDAAGNAVANTYTINSGYGSGAVAKGLGFLLNNEMDDFAAKVGVPNAYGLIQGEANAIQPGKRPLSSMTPTILIKDGKLAYVIGSPGGPTIINTVFQTILNLVDFDMNIQRAVAAPRIHHQWLPDEVRFEPLGLNPDTRLTLEKLGHRFAARAGSMGSCNSIAIDQRTGHRLAGVDPRSADAGAAGH
ncbi:MAG TPA: gamma-glutamyltransferase, partial [Fimbriimonadaceae bacterium]|nr:gamma-glutamyltransferase [Fimbriimonadaceae bacterium]